MFIVCKGAIDHPEMYRDFMVEAIEHYTKGWQAALAGESYTHFQSSYWQQGWRAAYLPNQAEAKEFEKIVGKPYKL